MLSSDSMAPLNGWESCPCECWLKAWLRRSGISKKRGFAHTMLKKVRTKAIDRIVYVAQKQAKTLNQKVKHNKQHFCQHPVNYRMKKLFKTCSYKNINSWPSTIVAWFKTNSGDKHIKNIHFVNVKFIKCMLLFDMFFTFVCFILLQHLSARVSHYMHVW